MGHLPLVATQPQCGPQHALTFILPAYATTAKIAVPLTRLRAPGDDEIRTGVSQGVDLALAY